MTVSNFAATQSETILYSFPGGANGCNPFAGVARDSKGNLYGTCLAVSNVFKVRPNGVLTLLHTFTGAGHGSEPYASLTLDPYGNLYGTPWYGFRTALDADGGWQGRIVTIL